LTGIVNCNISGGNWLSVNSYWSELKNKGFTQIKIVTSELNSDDIVGNAVRHIIEYHAATQKTTATRVQTKIKGPQTLFIPIPKTAYGSPFRRLMRTQIRRSQKPNLEIYTSHN
jgi:hypothetical protein